MQFIRISSLRQQLPDIVFPVPADQLNVFREHFYTCEAAAALTIPEKEQWIERLRSEEYVLFIEWAEQERNLAELLSGGKLAPFQNTTNVLQHALFYSFQAFITPFLHRALADRMKNTKPAEWEAGLSYIPLLAEREADLVQSVVYDQVKAERDKLHTLMRSAKTDETLQKVIRPYVTPQYITILNSFTSSFYRVKVVWMDLVKEVMAHPASSRRLVMYLLRELGKLNLQPDHVLEMQQLEREIKIGAVKVEEKKVPLKVMVLLSLATLLVIGVVLLLVLAPTEPEHNKVQERTSYMDFTEEERKTIDSLLSDIQTEREHKDEVIDQSDMNYVGEELTLRVPLRNQDAEYLLESWESKDSSTHKPDPAESRPFDDPFPMTEPLSEKRGSIRAKFQNDTELSVLIMVFRDTEDEWVYTEYLEKKGVTTFRISPGEHLYVLPGTKIDKGTQYSDLPFRQVDSRFFRQLEQDYVIDDLSPASIKLVWKALNGYDLFLLDVNDALVH